MGKKTPKPKKLCPSGEETVAATFICDTETPLWEENNALGKSASAALGTTQN